MHNLVIPARSPSMPADKNLVVPVVNPSNQTFIASYSSSNYILDPEFPAIKPSDREYNNCVFGRRFGIPVSTASSVCARRISNGGLLRSPLSLLTVFRHPLMHLIIRHFWMIICTTVSLFAFDPFSLMP